MTRITPVSGHQEVQVTTATGLILVQQIMPIIVAAIAKGAVRPTRCDDVAELQAAALALAAKMLESAERRGKDVSAQSVAYYSIASVKSGRRSGYTGQADVLSAAATVSGRVQVQSLDEARGLDEDDPGCEFTLHDMLADQGEDVDTAAARHLDWNDVLGRLDDRRVALLTADVSGYGTGEIAAQLGVSAPRVCQIRESIGNYIVATWGDNGITDATTPSQWRAGLRAVAEKRAGWYAWGRRIAA